MQFIQSRSGQMIALFLDPIAGAKGWAVVSHGMGGFSDQAHIVAMAKGLQDAGYSIVRWDARHSIGESEGSTEDATPTSYYEDLEDVISWTHTEQSRGQPLVLAGHSLGAMTSILYAERHPEQCSALIPVSPAISGKLTLETGWWPKALLRSWQETGHYDEPSIAKPGVTKRWSWNFVEDFETYDVLPETGSLTMPVLCISGGADSGAPLAILQPFYDRIPGEGKELVIITDGPHTFTHTAHLDQLRDVIATWLYI